VDGHQQEGNTMVEPSDLRTTGARIEQLLDASAAAGPVARQRAEELVRLVVELYGAGLRRLLEIVDEAGGLDETVLERLAGDDLVASLLLVHGLHPYSVEERIERALARQRPLLDAHGGDVRLLGVSGGVVRLRVYGGGGCGSAALRAAAERAVAEAAPEVARVEVEELPAAAVIPVDALAARLRSSEHADPAGE
jgi:Fe-S cluster biogenesis protein NfuA